MGDHILQEQVEYYRARANEYDEWFLRQGRYDRGPAHRTAWFDELAVVEAALAQELQSGEVLELACGTGLWTQHLARRHSRVLAVDASPEVIAVNRRRVQSDAVEYVVADLFTWDPGARFDAVFFGFWLSHVPPERFVAFWNLVRSCLAPGGRVFFVDSRREPTSTAVNHRLPEPDSIVGRRRLNDGREFHVYKIFYEPEHLTSRLRQLGWQFEIQQTDHYFLYGSGEPNDLRT